LLPILKLRYEEDDLELLDELPLLDTLLPGPPGKSPFL